MSYETIVVAALNRDLWPFGLGRNYQHWRLKVIDDAYGHI